MATLVTISDPSGLNRLLISVVTVYSWHITIGSGQMLDH